MSPFYVIAITGPAEISSYSKIVRESGDRVREGECPPILPDQQHPPRTNLIRTPNSEICSKLPATSPAAQIWIEFLG